MRVAAVTAKMPTAEMTRVRIACPWRPESEVTISSISRRAKNGTAISSPAVSENKRREANQRPSMPAQ